MPGPFPSDLPPRGSTDWGVRQFLRVLDEEERQRLLAMMQGRPVAKGSIDHGFSNFAGSPDQDQQLLQLALYSSPPPGGARPSVLPAPFGSPRPVPVPQVKEIAPPRLPVDPPAKLSPEATQRNIARGYTGQHGEGRGLPDGYVPRYGGLSEEVATRQARRAATYQWLQEQQAWDRQRAIELVPEEGDERSFLESVWDTLGSPFSNVPTERPPVPAARIADEHVLVQEVVEAFSDAGIFLWESQETRQDNLDIINMIRQAARACGRKALHTHGASKPERILRQQDSTGLKGSRRPDGTVIIGDPENPEYIWDFNTVDVRPSQGNRLTTREATAKIAIEALKAEIDKERITRFDAYEKSKGKDRAKWRAKIRLLVEAAVRALLKC